MSERMSPGPVNSNNCLSNGFREAVCIHTNKVYDSCKSKECVRDLRVYLTTESQAFINNHCVNVKPRCAELLYANIDVEKIQYNKGFYSVDVRFFYRITVEASTNVGCPRLLNGLAVYDKRAVLFGSDGGARIFSSRYCQNGADLQYLQSANKPIAVVETVEPVILEAKIVEPNYCCGCCCEVNNVPNCVGQCFGGEDIALDDNCNKLFVTLGQFSIMRLERDIQLLMPAYDICMPERDCSCSDDGSCDDPCEIFERFEFPVDAFFPPKQETRHNDCGCNEQRRNDGCGCNKMNKCR